ncbi:MAG: transglycosylase domain-containing protein, partial [Eubacteriales bacterium]|nr:transglycosylase domain-containing protein [Eubacteriales bacterium]
LQVLSPERTYKRKIQEAWLALQLETTYDKDQILEAYLNAIPLGQSNYGVKAAAQDYFGKGLSELSLRECAMLAGLTQSPYTYDPRANTYSRNRMDLTDRRTDTVLMRMYECGYIGKDEYQAALEADVSIVQRSEYKAMYDMPYFVEYVIQDVVQRFLQQRELEDTAANRQSIHNELRTGGYHIYTTVDPTVQKAVEDTLYTWTKYPSMRYSQDKYTVDSTSGSSFTRIEQPQAAAVVYDYHTGQLKAIVGGRSQPTARMTLNRAYQSHMPVGSSIKPLAVYTPALDLGLSPATPALNAPVPIEGWNSGNGYPNNYGGGGFTGLISLREAVKKSLNVVAARTLLDNVGVNTSMDYLRAMGVTQGVNEDGAGLALGTSGISPLEMAVAYGTLGNAGEYVEAFSFTKVTDSHGKVLLDAENLRTRTQVFKPAAAYLMTDILVDAVQGGTGTRAKISGMTVAGKTGTNSENVGVSFGGLTPYYSAFVWVGHDKYKPLASSATGSTAAAPLWQAFMAKIHSGLPNANIIDATPESLGLVKATVCSISGKLATEACQLDQHGHTPVTDYFMPGTVPIDTCDMHQTLQICDESGKIATEYCPKDHISEKAILAVPEDSPLRLLTPEDLAKYFPHAVLDYPTGDALAHFTPDNPDYAAYFCDIHTADWQHEQQSLTEARQSARQAIDDARQYAQQQPDLTEGQKQALEAAVQSLQQRIDAQDTTTAQLKQATADFKEYTRKMLS